VQGDLDLLPEPHRTCVFRAIQEALTNCIRHARAHAITVTLRGGHDRLHVSVTDDGIGLDPAQRRDGLGLRGIEERVKELQGTIQIARGPRGGTTVTINLPLPRMKAEVSLARAAG
jgi:signal transduction histidine kinase